MENNSKLYVCFLDAKQAFDYVWHAGLFLKLHELGIDLYLWKTIVIYIKISQVMSNFVDSNLQSLKSSKVQGKVVLHLR